MEKEKKVGWAGERENKVGSWLASCECITHGQTRNIHVWVVVGSGGIHQT